MRFNPPPNWPPPPPGWHPEPTWQPDPGWGPPPLEWPLWVPERRRKGPIIAALIAAAVVAAVAVTLFIVLTESKSKGAAFAATIKCAADDAAEEEVCDSIRQRAAALMDHDKKRMRELTCASHAPLSDEGFDEEIAAFRAGDLHISITGVVIKGDKARITLFQEQGGMSGTLKVEWARENGTWKACSGALND
jgi:hypothetical protein